MLCAITPAAPNPAVLIALLCARTVTWPPAPAAPPAAADDHGVVDRNRGNPARAGGRRGASLAAAAADALRDDAVRPIPRRRDGRVNIRGNLIATAAGTALAADRDAEVGSIGNLARLEKARDVAERLARIEPRHNRVVRRGIGSGRAAEPAAAADRLRQHAGCVAAMGRDRRRDNDRNGTTGAAGSALRTQVERGADVAAARVRKRRPDAERIALRGAAAAADALRKDADCARTVGRDAVSGINSHLHRTAAAANAALAAEAYIDRIVAAAAEGLGIAAAEPCIAAAAADRLSLDPVCEIAIGDDGGR